jgi:hypothetical protein
LCGFEFWFLTSRKEHRLRVFVSRAIGLRVFVGRVVRRIFGVRGRKGQRDAEDSVASFMTVTLHQMLTHLVEKGLGICGI